MQELSEKVIEKFWARLEKTDECWNWTGPVHHNAPVLQLVDSEGVLRGYSPRRISLFLIGKVINQSERVLPLVCGNGLCVNPNHLVFGDEGRFWSKVDKTGDCWIWTAGLTSPAHGGYGKHTISENGKKHTVGTHRYSWIFAHGPIPDGFVVCHMCDNPPCVNPNHLFLGTIKDNVWDCVRKGRNARGERNGHSKLTDEIVREIKSTCNVLELSKKYDVSVRTILDLVFDKSWRHIKIEE